MSYVGAGVQRVAVAPINLVFRFLQSRSRVIIWLRDITNKRFEGIIIGFDEFMNLVLADTVEMNTRTNFQRKIGTILLRGETVTLIQSANPDEQCSLDTITSKNTARAGTSKDTGLVD